MTNKTDIILKSTPVTVEQMARRRENRCTKQLQMLAGNRMPLICFTMNIAGPVKLNPLIAFAFDVGVMAINAGLKAAGFPIGQFDEFWNATGPEAFFSVDCGDAAELKRLTQRIEDALPAGRLFDIDVIGKNNEKFSRSEPRRCLICENPARICARSRAHSVDELISRTNSILTEFAAGLIASLGTQSLIREVHITPKPGLVDENNNGANSDMDIGTFEASAGAIEPFFYDMCRLAIRSGNQYLSQPSELMLRLAQIGIEAERAMLASTNGVNTHRGAIYAIGLLICASCIAIANNGEADIATVCGIASRLARNQPGRADEYNTNGSRMCKLFGVNGARGQAASGFPIAVEAYRKYVEMKFKSPETAWPAALLHIMSKLDDTNTLKRAGSAGAEYVKREAARLMDGRMNADALMRFDAELIRMNISCGGAADMLAAAIFFNMLENELGLCSGLI